MMQEIIDFHVHPFRSPAYCLNFYPEMEVQDAAGVMAGLRRAGITGICGSVLKKNSCPSDFGEIRALNREALALREQMGNFYTPGFHIHPAYVRQSCEEIEWMHSRGVHLIGELVPYMHGWSEFAENNWMEIMDLAEQCGMVCSYHTPFSYDMNRMLAEHPGIPFVAAHPGDHGRVPEHIEMMKKYENLYLDLSGTGLFRLGLVKHLVNEVGADRILFGTDYPICNPGMYVQAVCYEDIPDDAKQKILCENAKRILNLG